MPVPYEKLMKFQRQLGLTDESLLELDPYRKVLISEKETFAAYFYSFFQSLPDARVVLDYEQMPGHMLKIWSHWFEKIFGSSLNADLYAYLWRIGLRHVEVNLDQRFSNLGFSVIRQFCHMVVLAHTEPGDKTAAIQLIDKIMDFCLLIETSAYIEATTRCDIEIIKGIADRVRNPVAVIGGSLNRLLRKVDADSPAYAAYEGLLGENRRLEHMVNDIKTYFEMFQENPRFEALRIDDLLAETIKSLPHQSVKVQTDISPDALYINADAKDMAAAFRHALENSFEGVDTSDPLVIVSSKRVMEPYPRIEVTVFNTGTPFQVSNIDRLSMPFYSTKPSGTGFGLPIIRLAMRKNHGKVTFEPVNEKGTRVTMLLPAAETRAEPSVRDG